MWSTSAFTVADFRVYSLNATFGNAVEAIVSHSHSVIALRHMGLQAYASISTLGRHCSSLSRSITYRTNFNARINPFQSAIGSWNVLLGRWQELQTS